MTVRCRRAALTWALFSLVGAACRERPAPEANPQQTGSATPAAFVRLEAGSYRAGSPPTEACRGRDEGPNRETVEHGLEVGVLEVGQAEFTDRMGFDPSFNADCPECPVDSVTYSEAAAYCNALSEQAGLERCYRCTERGDLFSCTLVEGTAATCEGYRLPSEVEWEYLARAGTQTATYAGRVSACMSADEVVDQIGWYKANSEGRTHPRGQKLPNAWGLYDVAGNVYEWTEGVVDEEGDASTADEPTVGFRVLRGGSWFHNAHHCRSASRLRVPPGRRLSYAGFRCVRTLGDSE